MASRVVHGRLALTQIIVLLLLIIIFAGLQGHAAKNQDLLVASGAISLKGPDAMSALDDDIQAAVGRGLLLSPPSNIVSSAAVPYTSPVSIPYSTRHITRAPSKRPGTDRNC